MWLKCPQGRVIEPGQVADAVAWLAGVHTSEAAGAINGQSLSVSGAEVT